MLTLKKYYIFITIYFNFYDKISLIKFTDSKKMVSFFIIGRI